MDFVSSNSTSHPTSAASNVSLFGDQSSEPTDTDETCMPSSGHVAPGEENCISSSMGVASANSTESNLDWIGCKEGSSRPGFLENSEPSSSTTYDDSSSDTYVFILGDQSYAPRETSMASLLSSGHLAPSMGFTSDNTETNLDWIVYKQETSRPGLLENSESSSITACDSSSATYFSLPGDQTIVPRDTDKECILNSGNLAPGEANSIGVTSSNSTESNLDGIGFKQKSSRLLLEDAILRSTLCDSSAAMHDSLSANLSSVNKDTDVEYMLSNGHLIPGGENSFSSNEQASSTSIGTTANCVEANLDRQGSKQETSKPGLLENYEPRNISHYSSAAKYDGIFPRNRSSSPMHTDGVCSGHLDPIQENLITSSSEILSLLGSSQESSRYFPLEDSMNNSKTFSESSVVSTSNVLGKQDPPSGYLTEMLIYGSFLSDEDSDSTAGIESESSDFIQTKCEWLECERDFSTQEDLVEHVREDHTDLSGVCKWKNCSREGKQFQPIGIFTRHMRRHTRERPCKCQIEGCNKAYSTDWGLKSHMTEHAGEKPYRSDFPGCTKAYNHATRLRRHQKRFSHTDLSGNNTSNNTSATTHESFAENRSSVHQDSDVVSEQSSKYLVPEEENSITSSLED